MPALAPAYLVQARSMDRGLFDISCICEEAAVEVQKLMPDPSIRA